MLADAGVVGSARAGRETRFALEPARLAAARAYLDVVARQWDAALARLKAHVEGRGGGRGEPGVRSLARRPGLG